MIELNILMQKHIRNKRVIEPEKNFSFKEQKLKDGCEVISFKKKKKIHTKLSVVRKGLFVEDTMRQFCPIVNQPINPHSGSSVLCFIKNKKATEQPRV